MSVSGTVRRLYGECMRKKKLTEKYADNVITKAKQTGQTLFKYSCPHCLCWHVSKKNQHGKSNA